MENCVEHFFVGQFDFKMFFVLMKIWSKVHTSRRRGAIVNWMDFSWCFSIDQYDLCVAYPVWTYVRIELFGVANVFSRNFFGYNQGIHYNHTDGVGKMWDIILLCCWNIHVVAQFGMDL